MQAERIKYKYSVDEADSEYAYTFFTHREYSDDLGYLAEAMVEDYTQRTGDDNNPIDVYIFDASDKLLGAFCVEIEMIRCFNAAPKEF